MSAMQDSMHDEFKRTAFIKTLGIYDWLFAAITLYGSYYAWGEYKHLMDAYEVGILFGTGLSMIALGWTWKQSRSLMLAVAGLSIFGVMQYGGGLAPAETNFFLRFFIKIYYYIPPKYKINISISVIIL